MLFLSVFFASYLCTCSASNAATVAIAWGNTLITSKTTPTLQVVVNPLLERKFPVSKQMFESLRQLEADYIRYVPWCDVKIEKKPTRSKFSFQASLSSIGRCRTRPTVGPMAVHPTSAGGAERMERIVVLFPRRHKQGGELSVITSILYVFLSRFILLAMGHRKARAGISRWVTAVRLIRQRLWRRRAWEQAVARFP